MTRRGFALPLAALLLAAAFAGCAGDAALPPPPSTVEALLVTDANDEASLANESFMMQAHQHDYWDGKERLVVLDTQVETGGLWFGGMLPFAFVPPDGSVVPQGAARVDVTISWTDGSRAFYRNPELAVKTAADHEPKVVGPTDQGLTLSIPVTLADADLPHQSISAWRFEWRLQPGMFPEGTLPGVWWDGTIHIRVEAVRGLEIPVYPPHPDLWDGAETIPLFDDAKDTQLWFGDSENWSCFMECPMIHRPANGTVVPYDAAAVEVILEPGDDAPHDFGLKFHGGDTRAWQDLAPASVEGRRQTFVIPITPGMGDSPYATQSVWEFAIYSTAPERDSVTLGSYTLGARALKLAPDA